MIVLDTNVVSEFLRNASTIDAWLLDQPRADLALTTVTIAEITYGISRMAEGRRRELLATAWASLESNWPGQVLPLGLSEARTAGVAKAVRVISGRPMSESDSYIAGICLAHRANLATRNTKDFEGLGLVLINPWAL